jgi:hypothetical protein
MAAPIGSQGSEPGSDEVVVTSCLVHPSSVENPGDSERPTLSLSVKLTLRDPKAAKYVGFLGQ